VLCLCVAGLLRGFVLRNGKILTDMCAGGKFAV
jgi:hypothetical protein